MIARAPGGAAGVCSRCGSEHPAGALVCPLCHALLHKDELERLRDAARRAAARDDTAGEVRALEAMEALLPADSAQGDVVQKRLRDLAARSSRRRFSMPRWGAIGGLGALALLVWKLKSVVAFALTKGKALLAGLSQGKTLFSMLIALGAYWAVWGWKFALGFVLSIYVHEMGHVFALRRLGIPATAPMFVPFVGAFVRLRQTPRTAHEDAIVGLAGPAYGLAAAIGCWLVFLATDASLIGALARAGAWINLFNLVPIWQLDGGRGFNAMSRAERWAMVGALGLVWLATGEGLLLLLLLGALYRAAATPPAPAHDVRASLTYAALVASLGALARVELPELALS